MEASVLWSPERGKCSQCGVFHTHVRCYTMDGVATKFCQSCWSDFLADECNVAPGTWQADVIGSWRQAVTLCLEFEEERGTAQGPARWN